MAWWKVLVISAAFFAGDVDARYQRIIKGEDSVIEEFPYQASLRLRDAHFCGASIIGQRHIVTAGHCIGKNMVFPYHMYSVATGTSTRRGRRNGHQIADVTVHPQFWSDKNRAVHDIAVITLKDDIVFDKYQQKINLPEHNYQAGGKANVTGWGLIHQLPPVRPNQLQMIEVELITREKCQEQIGRTEVFDTEVCIQRKSGSGVCSGDSGGPLAANGELVGIVSWSDGLFCAADQPDVFTNVYEYKDFVKSVMDEKN